jgi:PhzF family phenazine biosynthesis protein
MTIPYYEVLAFTERPFGGNPAGVCLLEKEWLPEKTMQQIAAENQLAETAFLVPRNGHFDVRWFAPALEIDLCGHATLASAHVLFEHLGFAEPLIRFQSKSGELRVSKAGGHLVLDFPAQPAQPCDPPSTLAKALGAVPKEVLKARDYFAVLDREEDVSAVKPNLELISELDAQGVVVTAPGNSSDFVSRYFAPSAGIPEDPVTGSTHTSLIPFWAQRLNKKKLFARQLSARGGELFCQDNGERVDIGGDALTYVEGRLYAA